MTTRVYDNALRAAQAERTRETILEAMIAELANGTEELSIPRVAKRAGVSVSTVYHHFPNREKQVEAMAAFIEARLGHDPEPTSLSEIPAYSVQRARKFREHEAFVRAQLSPGMGSQVRAQRRKRRTAAIDACVREADLAPPAARVGAAVLKHLVSADLQVSLLDRCNLTHDEAERAVHWLVTLVTQALRSGDVPTAAPPRNGAKD